MSEVPELVRAVAARTPGAVAVQAGGVELTYGELISRSAEIALQLQAFGAGPGSVVGVCARRGIGLVQACLAAWTAGAPYLPLDPEHPDARREGMLEDAHAAALVTGELVSATTFGAGADSGMLTGAAYVVYTSGSTGRPKGVVVGHDSLAGLVAWHRSAFAVAPGTRVALMAGVGFDASAWELWGTLAAGGTLVVPDDTVRLDPVVLRDWLVDQCIEISFVPTVLAEQLIALPWPEGAALRSLLTGGERLKRRPPPDLPFELVNNYGPTEATVVATSAVIGADGTELPEIGLVRAGLTAEVMESGELVLGGPGVARGYLGRPDLTAERFEITDEARRYRTGDIVHRAADGRLRFIGRLDDQVKIRGHRIEPAEVEAALLEHPLVRAAAVRVQGEHLVAHLVADQVPPGLRDRLRERLPEAWIPQGFTTIDRLPLTPNGKLDPARLPPVDLTRELRGVPPRTAVEQEVLAAWQEVLELPELGVDDPFDRAGGTSLSAARIATRLDERFGLRVPLARFFGGLTVEQVATSVKSSQPQLDPIPWDSGPVAASGAQRRLWFLQSLASDPALYTNALLFDLAGEVDREALRRALTALTERHPALRTAVVDQGAGPIQIVRPVREIELPAVEASRAAREQAARTPFDLTTGDLLRATLLTRDGEPRQLLLAVHHVAIDGWSIGILVNDLVALYANTPLPPLTTTYAEATRDFDDDRGEEWWRGVLAGEVGPVRVPSDRPRPVTPAFVGRTIVQPVAPELLRSAGELARGEQGTLFTAALAAFAGLLQRYTGQTDLVIGAPAANRPTAASEAVVGCFVNTLPLRCDLSGRPTFRQAVRDARDVVLGALDHQQVPFERILAVSGTSSAREARPLVTVMLAVQPPTPPARGGGLEIAFTEELHATTARFDLTLSVERRAGEPVVALEYDTELFDDNWADQLLRHLLTLLAAAVAEPDRPLDELPLLDAAEEKATTAIGRGELRELPATTVPELIAANAIRTPERLAVECGDESLTYAVLLERVAAEAERLRAHGVRDGDPVAVCVERSVDSVVALLAVLAARGVYVPLDPAHPDGRLAEIIETVRPELTLAGVSSSLRMKRLGGEVLVLSTARSSDGLESDDRENPPAYTIFTSGSTGRPKGVTVGARALLNLTLGKIERFIEDGETRALQYVPFGFGVSISDVCTTLAAGGTLVVRGPEVLAGAELAGLLREKRISHLVVPASLLASLPAVELPALRVIAVGGEPCPADLVRRWAPGRVFVQAYGPTEAAVATTTAVLTGTEPGRPPVGHALPNTAVLLLDPLRRPVPRGVVGEVYIAGAGLATGYLGQPDLTAERFVHRGPERVYRTGDLGRFRADGSLELLGRTDDQVQLHGVRVEITEVEAALRSLPGVVDAAAAVHDHAVSGPRLIGYVVGTPAGPVREALRTRLPDALVPADVVVLDALPRTVTGKLDRRALPAPVLRAPGRRPLSTATEEAVAEVWRPVLETGELGPDDDFFALGGHSILAAQIAGRLRERFGVALPTRALFEAPTIARLAARIDALTPSALTPSALTPAALTPSALSPAALTPSAPTPAALTPSALTPSAPAWAAGPAPAGELSPARRRMWFLHRMAPSSAAYVIPVAWRLRGPLDAGRLEAALRTVAARHPVLLTTYTERDGEPDPVVHAATELTLDRGEWRPEAGRPFDLARDLPLRAVLHETGVDEHELALVVHHIAADGWSIGLIVAEVSAAYAGRELPPLVPGAASPSAAYAGSELPPASAAPASPSAAYAGSEALSALAGGVSPSAADEEASIEHWRARLAGRPAALRLPADERPGSPDEGAIRSTPLPAGLATAVRAFAAARRATPFMVLLAGFVAACARWTGADDLLLGTATGGRETPALENVVGCFVNSLPVRVPVPADQPGGELVEVIRARMLEDLEHAAVPFDRIVERLGLAGTTLYETMVVATNVPRSPLTLENLDAEPLFADPGAAKLDLSLSVDEIGGTTELAFTYRTARFTEADVDRLAAQYVTLLEHLIREPGTAVGELSLGPAPAAEPRVRRPGTVLDLIDRWITERASQRAVGEYTWAALGERAAAVASTLGSAGIGRGDVVGLVAERHPDTVAGLLGILRSGAAYVPVEPDARAAAMLGRVDAKAVVGRRELAGLPFVPVSVTATPFVPERPRPDDLAYVLFTSGSTGEPKGVEVAHRHLFAYVKSILGVLGEGNDRFALVSTLAADLGHTSLFGSLASGGELVVLDRDAAADGRALAAADHDVLKIVPSHLAALLDTAGAGVLPRRVLVLGGEAASWGLVDRVRELRPGLRIVNHYGPTEATVGALTWEVSLDGAGRPATVPLGRALPHAVAEVRDRGGRAVPAGVVGELWLGGAAVARGYRGDPELTAARFRAGWYRTGDRARRRPDGAVEFLGRVDDQVKIRGYRVEPGEVTAVLRTAPGVRDAAVVAVAAQTSGENRLVAYVVGGGAAGARSWLTARLPAHLVPSAFVSLDALPLTANGKLDRRALPEIRPSTESSERPEPKTATEKAIAGIWSGLLGLSVSVDDDFFALGGHSLMAARVSARIRSDLGVEVPLRSLFAHPALGALAAHVDALRWASRTPAARVGELVEEGVL